MNRCHLYVANTSCAMLHNQEVIPATMAFFFDMQQQYRRTEVVSHVAVLLEEAQESLRFTTRVYGPAFRWRYGRIVRVSIHCTVLHPFVRAYLPWRCERRALGGGRCSHRLCGVADVPAFALVLDLLSPYVLMKWFIVHRVTDNSCTDLC